jgi:hypothetical protein
MGIFAWRACSDVTTSFFLVDFVVFAWGILHCMGIFAWRTCSDLTTSFFAGGFFSFVRSLASGLLMDFS